MMRLDRMPAAGSSSRRHLLIRADAGPSIGTGHVMRCLALAQAWRSRGGSVQFLSARIPHPLQKRLGQEGCAVHAVDVDPGSSADADRLGQMARAQRPAWVVLDGYRFGTDYQQRVRQQGIRLLVLDDFGHAEQYACDAILNQNLGADPLRYRHRDRSTRLLLGTRYVLLRREFLRSGTVGPREGSQPGCILVTFGGSDPRGMTLKVIHALERIGDVDLEVNVLVGSAFANRDALDRSAAQSRHTVRLMRDPRDLPRIMALADLAISAGGSTCWELCHAGVPQLILVTAENQWAIAAQLAAAGQRNLGWYDNCSAERIASSVCQLWIDRTERQAMVRSARRLVDGRGAERVVDFLHQPADPLP